MSLSKAIVYYTCNTHRMDIELACRKQLLKTKLPIISVSREKEIDFGDIKAVVFGERSPLTMHRQVHTGLQLAKFDVVFLCESDVLYHPSHFDLDIERSDTFYYNTNVWRVRYPDGHAIWTDNLQQVSGCYSNRDLLLDFYTKRLEQINKEGFNRHYEPGLKQTLGGKFVTTSLSSFSNLDIRHDKNITQSKWSIADFRNKEYAKGWKEDSWIPGWGITEGRFEEFLAEI